MSGDRSTGEIEMGQAIISIKSVIIVNSLIIYAIFNRNGKVMSGGFPFETCCLVQALCYRFDIHKNPHLISRQACLH